MNIDAGFIATVLRDGDPRKFTLVEPDWVMGDKWVKAYNFISACLENPEIGTLPAPDTVALRYEVELPDTRETVGYYVGELRKRKARMDLEAQLRGPILDMLKGDNPDKDDPIGAAELAMTVAADIRRKYRPDFHGGEDELHAGLDDCWQAYLEREENQGLIGIPYPWEGLNLATGGLIGGELTAILGNPGCGKSWLILKVALHAHAQGKTVLMVSQEMQPRRLKLRAHALLAGVSPERFWRGQLEERERQKMQEYFHQDVSKFHQKLHLYGPREITSLGVFEAHLSALSSDVDLVVWDSPYLCSRSEKWEDRAQFVLELKQLAEMYNKPILVSWQMREGVPAFTRAIWQDADHNFVLNREDVHKAKKEAAIRSLKTRDGLELEELLMRWDTAAGVFEQLAWRIDGLGNSLDNAEPPEGSFQVPVSVVTSLEQQEGE